MQPVATPLPAKNPVVRGKALGAVLLGIASLGQLAWSATPDELDWVPRDRLTAEQLESCPVGCSGAYVAPVLDDEQAPGEVLLRAEADSSSIDQVQDIVTAEGDVAVQQGERTLRADRAVIDQNSGQYEISGNIVLREPGLLIRGDSAVINSADDAMRLTNTEFVLHAQRVHGAADLLGRNPDGTIFIDNALYTTCEPGFEAWQLVAGAIDIDIEEDTVVARDMRLEVRGVPVFYTPYISFPLSDARKTGLLYPDLSSSSERGLDITQPIYLNLAENYDLTLNPRWLEKHGVLLGAEARYLDRHTLTSFSASVLGNEQGDTAASRPLRGQDRWFVNLDHRGAWDRWLTRIDYSETSDAGYLDEIGDSALSSYDNSHLNQLGALQYAGDRFNATLQTRRYQSVSEMPTPFQQAPRLDVTGNLPLTERIDLDWLYHFASFERSGSAAFANVPSYQIDSTGTYVTGVRQRAELQISLRQDWDWGFVEPALGYKQLGYRLNDPVSIGSGDDRPQAGVPVFSLDSGLVFERPLDNGGVQTLEPRFRYSYADQQDQTDMPVFDTTLRTLYYDALFSGDPFTGLDRIGDEHQITLGVTTRLWSDAMDAPIRFSLAQSYFLEAPATHIDPFLQAGLASATFDPADPRSLQAARARQTAEELDRNRSPLVAEGEFALDRHWAASATTVIQPGYDELERAQLSVHYRDEDLGALANFALYHDQATDRFRDLNRNGVIDPGELFESDIRQAEMSGAYPLSAQWTLVGRWSRDLTNDRELELFGGVRYEGCCWNATLVWRRWLDRNDLAAVPERDLIEDSGIFLSVQLNGLAGAGEGLDRIIERAIPGYRFRR